LIGCILLHIVTFSSVHQGSAITVWVFHPHSSLLQVARAGLEPASSRLKGG
jgi:hypothetical protein